MKEDVTQEQSQTEEDPVVLGNALREENEAAEKEREEREEKAALIGKEFQPLEDRVLCLLDDKEKKIGDIFIPDAAGEKKQEATVVAVGPGRTTEEGTVIPVKLVVGMRVVLPVYGGANVSVKGTKYQLMNEKDILGIIAGNVEVEVTDA